MGYRNDQFYGLDKGVASIDSSGLRTRYNYYHPDADNPRFIYPDRTVRTYEVEKVPVRSTIPGRPPEYDHRIVSKTQLLKRGFMRSVARTAGEEVRKCQFQFNPQTLTQNVTMSESMLSFFQQDPGQFAQPAAGNTNMSFTLLFDRTMEINNPLKGFAPPGSSVPQRPGSTDADPSNPWETGDPQYVGVLRDIAAFYGVVGQGVNEADIEGRIQEITNAIRSETIKDPAKDEESYNKSVEQIETVLGVNLGNYSLLVPRPMRMVFSSLYIVEGYVTSTSVTFQKFNTAFVPTQASVQLTMRAMHIGFASKNKDTFLTYSLREAEKAQAIVVEEERALVVETYDEVREDLGRVEMSIDAGNVVETNSMALWDASRPSEAESQSLILSFPGIGSVKDKMKEGGATLKVSASVKVFGYLIDSTTPTGREQSSPLIEIQGTWVVATVDDIEDRGDLGSDEVFKTLATSPSLFTPGEDDPDFGGNWRVVWDVRVELDHNGVRLNGGNTDTQDFVGDATNWIFNPLENNFSLAFNPMSGGAVSDSPIIDSDFDTSSGQTSDVGSWIEDALDPNSPNNSTVQFVDTTSGVS